MGMRWVESNKRKIEFKRLLAPLAWFHKDAIIEDTYQFRANPNAKNSIIGYREDLSQYEIFCPADLRKALIAYLNRAHKA